MWEQHRREIDRLAVELPALASEMPIVLAGDLNQDRDGSGWYGTKAVRDALTSALEGAGMVCLTDIDVVEAGHLKRHHLIDHVCASRSLADRGWRMACWEPVNADGIRMSDHPGLVVTIRIHDRD